jgi:hypothetical protein
MRMGITDALGETMMNAIDTGARRAICTACGTQFEAEHTTPPVHCPICCDVRQAVPPTGQAWTTLERLRITHVNGWRKLREHLYEIRTQPEFAIGQRALLALTPDGNVLWDCLALIDDATVDLVKALGGISAIAISHPHYYSTMVEWAHAFGCPIWLHEADREWVQRGDRSVSFWSGTTLQLNAYTTLLKLGGHFPGATVLHWATEEGTLLSGDVLQVTPDRTHVSFMLSYPNYLPLSAQTVREMARTLDGFDYTAVYGSFNHAEIESNGKQAVRASVDRYVALLETPALAGQARPQFTARSGNPDDPQQLGVTGT